LESRGAPLDCHCRNPQIPVYGTETLSSSAALELYPKCRNPQIPVYGTETKDAFEPHCRQLGSQSPNPGLRD